MKVYGEGTHKCWCLQWMIQLNELLYLRDRLVSHRSHVCSQIQVSDDCTESDGQTINRFYEWLHSMRTRIEIIVFSHIVSHLLSKTSLLCTVIKTFDKNYLSTLFLKLLDFRFKSIWIKKVKHNWNSILFSTWDR